MAEMRLKRLPDLGAIMPTTRSVDEPSLPHRHQSLFAPKSAHAIVAFLFTFSGG